MKLTSLKSHVTREDKSDLCIRLTDKETLGVPVKTVLTRLIKNNLWDETHRLFDIVYKQLPEDLERWSKNVRGIAGKEIRKMIKNKKGKEC